VLNLSWLCNGLYFKNGGLFICCGRDVRGPQLAMPRSVGKFIE
jgi:hypothetical protein